MGAYHMSGCPLLLTLTLPVCLTTNTLSVFFSPLCYLRYKRRSVPVAGDEDDEWPVIRMHEDSGCLGTGGVECCRTAPVRALDAAAVHLPLHPFPAVHTLLPEIQRHKHKEVRRKTQEQAGWSRGSAEGRKGGERKHSNVEDEMEEDEEEEVKKRQTQTWTRTQSCQREITQLPLDNLMVFWHHRD